MAVWGSRLWPSVLERTPRLNEARQMNKEACDAYIRRYGPPDCGSVVWAVYGIARKESRKKYHELKQSMTPGELRRRRKVIYIVVSVARSSPPRKALIIHSPTTLITGIARRVYAGNLSTMSVKRSDGLHLYRRSRDPRTGHGSHHQHMSSWQAARPWETRHCGGSTWTKSRRA